MSTTLLVDGNKTCTGCSETKTIDNFRPDSRSRGGYMTRCRACINKARRANRAANLERHREVNRNHYAKWKEKYRAKNLMALYGITVAEYEALLEKQNGLCAICHKPPTGKHNGARLNVDHDHETGRIRGLLCYHCNNGLGRFSDDPVVLRRAADYVEAV